MGLFKKVLTYGVMGVLVFLGISWYQNYQEQQKYNRAIQIIAQSTAKENSSTKNDASSKENSGTTNDSSSFETTKKSRINLTGEVTLEEVYTDWRIQSVDDTYPIVMKVRIKNLNSRKWLANSTDFSLSSEDGDTVNEDDLYSKVEQGVEQKKLALVDLAQNQSTEGWISFAVKKSKKYILTYSYDNETVQFPIQMPERNEKIDIKQSTTQKVTPFSD